MNKVIVVFPKKETAMNIRNLLVRGGIQVAAICTTGAQVMKFVDVMEEGIIICGYKMVDMMYSDIRAYLPSTFEILLVATPDKWRDGLAEGVIGLSVPIKVYDLLNTVEMMIENMERAAKKRRKEKRYRDPKHQKVIQEAKELLMGRNHMTEEEAHHYLQKSSMDSGTNIVETAYMVLRVMGE